MKKAISLLIVIALMLLSVLSFTSCTSKTDLTKDNYSQYIKTSIESSLNDRRHNIVTGTSGYAEIYCSVEISSAASYIKFYDCVVSLIVKVSYLEMQDDIGELSFDRKTSEIEVVCHLDIGGNGSRVGIFELPGSSLASNAQVLSYSIEAISGYVVVD